jgi:hypothetical protein
MAGRDARAPSKDQPYFDLQGGISPHCPALRPHGTNFTRTAPTSALRLSNFMRTDASLRAHRQA